MAYVVRRANQQVVEEGRGLLRPQGSERLMSDQPRPCQIGHEQAQRVRRPRLRVAVGSHHAQRRRGRGAAQQRGEQVEGVGACPLQVVERQ